MIREKLVMMVEVMILLMMTILIIIRIIILLLLLGYKYFKVFNSWVLHKNYDLTVFALIIDFWDIFLHTLTQVYIQGDLEQYGRVHRAFLTNNLLQLWNECTTAPPSVK